MSARAFNLTFCLSCAAALAADLLLDRTLHLEHVAYFETLVFGVALAARGLGWGFR